MEAETSDRIEALRTPENRFENLPDYPFAPHYVDVGHGLRMHYVDEGKGDPILCLHGEPSWSFLYRKTIPILAKDHRVIAPDLIGFGKSDKPVAKEAYTYSLHMDALRTLVTKLDLKRITLVCQDWGGLLGLPLAMEMPERFSRLVIMNTGLPTGDESPGPAFLAWRNLAAKTTDMDIGRVLETGTVTKLAAEVIGAYNAPFPDASYKAGAHQFPLLVPVKPDDEAAGPIRQARERLKEWEKPALVMFSDRDPITAAGARFFRAWIPTAAQEPEITIRGGGHFLQEDKGQEIAGHILEFIDRRPVE